MFFLVPAHPGFPGQIPQSRKTVVLCVCFIAFGLVYCNAVTLITDLICALFGRYAAVFVNQIYPGKSLKTSFVSPG